jgi:1,4-dihydroxy-2-naphthoyl-CoA hydrolase
VASLVGSTDSRDAARLAVAFPLMDLSDLPHQPLHDKLGIKITELTPERVVATMPVEGNTQPFGVLHGGASAVLAEGLASLGAWAHAQRQSPGALALGVDLNATHHRAATSGLVTGVASAIHLGRTTASYEIVITDDQDRRICTARLTCFIRPA